MRPKVGVRVVAAGFDCEAELKVFALHHHLIPVAGTGRERSTVQDAGDLLELLLSAGVDLVLAGHKHVPHVWRLEHLSIANAGTATSLKLRGETKPRASPTPSPAWNEFARSEVG